MKIAIIGGHLSPALAVIDALPQEHSVVFFGRKYAMEGDKTPSLEYQVIKERGIPFIPLKAARLQRRISKHTLPSLARFPVGLFQAAQQLRKQKPDVVMAFGGYLSVPVCFAAKSLGIPVVIHEQTLEAGLANKVIAPVADRICISWETSAKFFPKNKIVLTGNPLKKMSERPVTLPFHRDDNTLPIIYVTGGSTGSHKINSVIEEALPELLREYRVMHQTGDAAVYHDFDRLTEKRALLPEELQSRYHVVKFVNPSDVAGIMKQADVVVSRSGINTVTELLHFKKYAILIPLQVGQKQEQLKNAQFLKKQGIAEILLEDDATGADLLRLLAAVLEKKSHVEKKASSLDSFIYPDAADRIINTLSYVVSKKGIKKT